MYNGRRPITLGIQMMLANGPNSDIYDDFKLKKNNFGHRRLYKNISALKG